MNRRAMLKTFGATAAGIAASALPAAPAADDQQSTADATVEKNPYGSPPGTGISMPPYYLPTPSVKNRNNYFPQSEPLGPDEMRIIFMGSNPWPPRLTQASTCIMVELGGAKRLCFDFGPGCLRNIIANQVAVPELNDLFITHLHIDPFGELPYLYQFDPFNGRWKPLRVIGPSAARQNWGPGPRAKPSRRWAPGLRQALLWDRWLTATSARSPNATSGTTAACATTRTASR